MALVELAAAAEQAGWDGVFVWDTPYVGTDDVEVRKIFDAWSLLALMGDRTERVRLGTMITPLPWRRPAIVYRQALTMDRLSGGRFTLATGLGAPDAGGDQFAEPTDRRERAAILDEALAFWRQAMSGQTFTHAGHHLTATDVTFTPTPIDLRVWLVGAWNTDPAAWPRKRSLRRAMAWDGVLPQIMGADGHLGGRADPADLRAMVDWIATERDEPFDVVWEGGSEDDTNTTADVIRPWRDAGATWWLEPVWWSMYRHPGQPDAMRRRILAGPPTL